MTPERYYQIEVQGAPLTDEEKEAGWHFCDEWDFMLVGPGTPEQEACLCTTP